MEVAAADTASGKAELTPSDLIRAFNSLCEDAHATARSKGYWEKDQYQNIPTKLALVTSEIGQAIEIDRRLDYGSIEWKDALGDELADIVIAIMDLAEGHKIHLGRAMIQKMRMNKHRVLIHDTKY